MSEASLQDTARALVVEGKGILAADESSGTIEKRFDSIDVESTEANRRDYRELLFTTPGVGDHISGVILFDETLRQIRRRRHAAGPKILAGRRHHPRHQGRQGREGCWRAHPGETITEGLDGLRERLEEYVRSSARGSPSGAPSITDRRRRSRARLLPRPPTPTRWRATRR